MIRRLRPPAASYRRRQIGNIGGGGGGEIRKVAEPFARVERVVAVCISAYTEPANAWAGSTTVGLEAPVARPQASR